MQFKPHPLDSSRARVAREALRRFGGVLLAAWTRWNRDEGFLISAAMAYYAALSLFPLTLVLISGLGYFLRWSHHSASEQQQLLTLVGGNVSPWLGEQLGRLLEGVQVHAALGGRLGLVGLIFAALAMFVQFDSLLDRIWNVPLPASRGFWSNIRRTLVERLQAFLLMLAAGGAVIALLVLDLALSAVRVYILDLPAGKLAWQVAQLAISIGLNSLLFALIYKILPRAPVSWSEAFSGALLVAVVWKAGQMVLTSIVIGEKYSAYGVVGTFLAVMLWIYYACVVFFFGAEFVRCICKHCPPD